MLTPGMMIFAGAAVIVYGLTKGDMILFWLGVVLVIAGVIRLLVVRGGS